MARVVRSVRDSLETATGRVYRVRVCGRQRADGRWQGWIEFDPDDGSLVLRTAQETTQRSLADLEHWAATLTAVYFEGALTRAIDAAREPEIEVEQVPAYDAPAPDPHIGSGASETRVPGVQACESNEYHDVEGAVLDPISVYAHHGEAGLRQKLSLLSAHHLRGIGNGYRLLPDDFELAAFSEPELIDLIVAGVRGRCAA